MENLQREIDELKDNLLIELFKDAEMPTEIELSAIEKDRFLHALIVLHNGETPHEKLLLLQNKYLTLYNEKHQKFLENLNFDNNICEINSPNGNFDDFNCQADILNYKLDLLVVASNNLLDDASALAQNEFSLDNEILFRAGVELKTELLGKIKQNEKVYFAKGYNLNAKKIAKIVDKNFKDVSNYEFEQFENLLKQIFELAKDNDIKSMAIDLSAFKNLKNKEKFYKNVKKFIKNANKTLKIKIILNFL